MVGERDALEHARTEPFGERKEALRIGDTGKGDDMSGPPARRYPRSGLTRAASTGPGKPRRMRSCTPAAATPSSSGLAHDDGVDEPELEIESAPAGDRPE